MPKVRTKSHPHVELDVSDEEALDLRRLGALVDDDQASNTTPAVSGNQPKARGE